MDKFEYKVRAEEIKSLIAQGDYAQAAELADGIDWRRVKSVMMLCIISDLYKINRRYEDAIELLLLAYDRHPGGRTIVYSLCELSIKMEEFVQAVEYYKEFVQIAPRDTGRYILQYKLYEAQDVGLEERIAVLEELKKRDYREKWAYELAYLYHRVGLSTRCVEECDELILWFGEGKYVTKAMELKMLHQPLTAQQQQRYDHRFRQHVEQGSEASDQNNAYYGNVQPEAPYQDDAYYGNGQPEVPYQDNAYYGNVQPEAPYQNDAYYGNGQPEAPYQDDAYYGNGQPEASYQNDAYYGNGQPEASYQDIQSYESGKRGTADQEEEELDIQVKTVDVSQYNTINLQKELAEGLKEVLGEQEPVIEDPVTRNIVAPMFETDAEPTDMPEAEEAEEEQLQPKLQHSEVFFGETGEIGAAGSQRADEQVKTASEEETRLKELADVIAAETGGQLGAVISEAAGMEPQVTGQLSVEDILTEWETIRQNRAQKQEELDGVEELAEIEETGQDLLFDEAVAEDEPAGELPEGLTEDGDTEAFEEEPEEEIPEEVFEEEPEEEIPEEVFEEEPEEEAPEEVFEVEPEEEAPEESFAEEPEEEEVPEEAFGEEPEEEIPEETFEEEPEEEPEEEISGEAFEEEPEEEASEESFAEEPEEEETPEEAFEEEPEEEIPEEAFGEEPEEETPGEAFIEEAAENESQEEDLWGEAEEEVSEKKEAYKAPEKGQRAPVREKPSARAKEPVEQEKPHVRNLTKEEKELFASFIQNRSARVKLVAALDRISLAAYTGNVIITGDEGTDTLNLAKNMIRDVQMMDSNLSGKTAKISGSALNQKDVAVILEQLKNGALIIQKACDINEKTVAAMYKKLQQESLGIIVVIEDTRKRMDKFLAQNKKLAECFNARMDMEAPSNEALVAFGRKYARSMEHSIDELGILALHTRIENMQTIDHAVTIMEVQSIVDDAIRHAGRKTIKHFLDVLFAKRYDEEDMIILREDDFV